MLMKTKKNPSEKQELVRVKNILNNVVGTEGREGDGEFKTFVREEQDFYSYPLDSYAMAYKNRRKEKSKKEDVYSAENVENYQGRKVSSAKFVY